MTTFAQWRSPGNRLAAAGTGVRPRKYDMRMLDHFYVYCHAVARADRHRDDAARSQQATKRHLWAMLLGISVLGYHLVERIAQVISLF
jgi:hypothetical protein